MGTWIYPILKALDLDELALKKHVVPHCFLLIIFNSDFPRQHVDRMGMEMPIFYFKGSQPYGQKFLNYDVF